MSKNNTKNTKKYKETFQGWAYFSSSFFTNPYFSPGRGWGGASGQNIYPCQLTLFYSMSNKQVYLFYQFLCQLELVLCLIWVSCLDPHFVLGHTMAYYTNCQYSRPCIHMDYLLSAVCLPVIPPLCNMFFSELAHYIFFGFLHENRGP